jgi:hypothetical protein
VTALRRIVRAPGVGCRRLVLGGTSIVAALVAGAAVGAAQGQLAPGLEFQVNTYTVGDQAYPAACGNAQGHFVVVWESADQDGSGNAVRARRYDQNGAALSGELAVNTYTPGDQQLPAVACAPTGDFVVAWESYGQDGDDYGIFGQRFDSTGAAVGGEFQINSYTTDRQRAAAACSDGAGNFVVVWQSYGQDGDGYGIFGQRFDGTGATRGGEFQVNTVTEYSQEYPAVACTPAGDFVVVWQSEVQDGDGYGVFGQRFTSAGARSGTEFQVNTYTPGSQQLPAITADGAGNFVVVWESYDDQDGDGYGVFGQRFTSAGAPSGTEFQVNTYTAYSQEKPAIAASSSGDFTVAWSSGQDSDGYGVFARHFTGSGAPDGGEFQVNRYTLGDQGAVSDQGHVLAVAAGGNGSFLLVWQSTGVTVPAQDGSGAGIFAQRYSAGPAACPGDCNGDGAVTINELVVGVAIGLGNAPVSRCPAFDRNADGTVAIAELIAAVDADLGGCP